MKRSACPAAFSALNKTIPKLDPTRPPPNITPPILRSTLPLRQCVSTPETDEATICVDCVATATAGGIPKNMRNGAKINPPPTPNMPDKNPTAAPSPMMRNMFTGISAMGR